MRYDYQWHRAQTRRGRRGMRGGAAVALTLLIGVAGGLVAERMVPGEAVVRREASASATFGLCHTGGGTNCVVDGDTFWMAGVKIRMSDIDTPETHPSHCAAEADLGGRATRRLQALLNAGPVTLAIGARDVDRYGRKLRVVERGGVSLGDTLVAEGLARPWGGRRMAWC